MKVNKDTLWKGILENLFEDFLLYFYPDWTKSTIDLSKKFEFLDKELDQIYPVSKDKKRFADKLVKVFTKTGEENWVLIHVEVQGYEDKDFPERMFTYYYRIRDRWKKEIMALAILTDPNKDFHPTAFKREFYKTSLEYKFDTFKLLEKTTKDLDIEGNPFSIVMLTAYHALQKKKDQDILEWKTDLLRKLIEAGYQKQKIVMILNFLRYYINFDNKSLTETFENKVQELTKNRKNMGIEEAIKQEIIEKTENKRDKEIIQNMFKSGLNAEQIASYTGIDLKFVKQVEKQMKKK